MSDFTKAIYDRMANDATLTALLTELGGNPAIFSGDVIPQDAELPYIVMSGVISRDDNDTKTSSGWVEIRDIRCYDREQASAIRIENIASRVETLFHRFALVIDNHDNAMQVIASVGVSPVEEGVIGRIVTLNITAMES